MSATAPKSDVGMAPQHGFSKMGWEGNFFNKLSKQLYLVAKTKFIKVFLFLSIEQGEGFTLDFLPPEEGIESNSVTIDLDLPGRSDSSLEVYQVKIDGDMYTVRIEVITWHYNILHCKHFGLIKVNPC